jgi:hypothetical protein
MPGGDRGLVRDPERGDQFRENVKIQHDFYQHLSYDGYVGLE